MAIFALVVTVVCVRLGFWQLDRLQGRRFFNARFAAGMAVAPQAIDRLLPRSGSPPQDPTYRRVRAQGVYDTAEEVILYGRTLNERPGNHVLTPLVLPDGRVLIVDRGWVPFEMDVPPVAAAAPPATSVEVTGLLVPSEPGDPGDGPATTMVRVDLARLGRQIDRPLLPYYLQLRRQTPPQPGTLPAHPPAPELTEGPHLGYTLQWFAFATIAFGGFWLLVWHDSRDDRHGTQTPSSTSQLPPAC